MERFRGSTAGVKEEDGRGSAKKALLKVHMMKRRVSGRGKEKGEGGGTYASTFSFRH